MDVDRRLLLLALAAGLSGCASGGRSPSGGLARPQTIGDLPSDLPFAPWTDVEPEYRLYAGDEIEVVLPTATELNRQMRIGPDGRVSLPLVGHVTAADLSLAELEADISAGYAPHLLRPEVEVSLRQAGPLKVWVDGEVRNPGVFDMPGQIDAYQALVMAGGVLPTSNARACALIRRGPGDLRMLKVLDLRAPRGEIMPLRRGDILFVPRSTLGELAAFFTQIRSALPIGFSYAINGAYAST